jgi:hypothetical protein
VTESKPEWVPDWVWDEYLDAMRADYPPTLHADVKDTYEMLAHLIESPLCSTVWRAMDRHAKQFAEIEASSLFHTVHTNQVRALVREVENALCGLHGPERMTKAERAKVGRDIAKRAGQLRDLLQKLAGLEGLPDTELHGAEMAFFLPFEFMFAAGQVAKEQFEKDRHVPSESPALSRLLMHTCYGDLFGSLRAIERGAEAFGSRPPVVPKPNAENAVRTYFIRKITSYFARAYGTPLREGTLALASMFFDCADLDASAVAQLAPCD